MPKKSKGKKGKRKGKKGKKGKKKKEVPEPPPLHELTKLYNKLVEAVEEFKNSRNKARKKRIEAWYMTREMMNLNHDNAVYHKHLKEKMDEMENLFNELTDQLNKEREELDRIIAKRMEEMDRIIAEHKARTAKAEAQLQELKNKLLEFEPLMRELAALNAKLKELQALIPIYELEANIKTRHLKNQYLNERSKLHNHLEKELYHLILTCRSHLMPILADHMTSMEMENRCNRWELGILDMDNFKLYRQREKLLEKRNRLNMEREYLSIDWAFNKLAQIDARRKEDARVAFKQKKHKRPSTEEDCELAVAFRSYLSDKLNEIEEAKERERRAKLRREAREKRLKREAEKRRRQQLLEEKRAKAKAEKLRKAGGGAGLWDSEEEEDEMEDEWGELEYYEDDEGNWVIATPSRMLQHKAILENKELADVEQQVEDIKKMIAGKEDEGDYSGSGSGSWSGSTSEGSIDSAEEMEEDEQAAKRKSDKPPAGDDGFGGFDDDDFGQDDFGFDDDDIF